MDLSNKVTLKNRIEVVLNPENLMNCLTAMEYVLITHCLLEKN